MKIEAPTHGFGQQSANPTVNKTVRKKQAEVQPGEPLADDILPQSFPVQFGDPHLVNKIRQTMDGQILFSRHLRMVLKQGYGN